MDYMEKKCSWMSLSRQNQRARGRVPGGGLPGALRGGDVDREKERALMERCCPGGQGKTRVKPELYSGSTDCNNPSFPESPVCAWEALRAAAPKGCWDE